MTFTLDKYFSDEFFIPGLNLDLEICSAEIIDLGQSMLRCTYYYWDAVYRLHMYLVCIWSSVMSQMSCTCTYVDKNLSVKKVPEIHYYA